MDDGGEDGTSTWKCSKEEDGDLEDSEEEKAREEPCSNFALFL